MRVMLVRWRLFGLYGSIAGRYCSKECIFFCYPIGKTKCIIVVDLSMVHALSELYHVPFRLIISISMIRN